MLAAVALIDAISADPYSEAFLEPVEWKELGLLDYLTIVKKPMDFQTIKENLNSGAYPTYDAFFADIQLIWDNCKTYNMAGSEIYKICERMEKSARREINKFRQQQGLPL